MALVDLKLLKQQVRSDDYTGDDELLTQYLEAAEEHIFRNINRQSDELLGMNDGNLPKGIIQAIILLAGHWYKNREAVSEVSMSEVPYTISALLKPYTRLV